jgi:hypothetical protein
MPKYKFIYSVSNGAFQMDVFTGLYIIAENYKKAMSAAGRLDRIVTEQYNFQVTYEMLPKPYIAVKCNNIINKQDCKPNVIKYQIQRNFDSSNKLMGLPVFSDDDFEDVSKDDFIEELQNDYGLNFRNSKINISFEIISYQVQCINTQR